METQETNAAIEHEENVEVTKTVETVETTNTEEVVETEVVETEEQPAPWYSSFGYESEDTAKTEIETLRTFKDKATQLEERERELNSVFEELNNPVPEGLKEVVAFAKQHKIEDLSTITQILGVKDEDAANDPIKVLSLEMKLKNPTKYNVLGGAKGVEEAIREKYNLPIDGEYTAPKMLIADAADALGTLKEMKNNVKSDENPFNFAAQTKAEREAAQSQKLTLVSSELETFAKTLKTVEYKAGESSYKLGVSKDEVAKVLEDAKAVAQYMNVDLSKPEGKKALHDWATDQIVYSKFKSGDWAKEIEKSVRAQAEKSAVKDLHNGQPKTVNRGGKTVETETKKSAIRLAAERDGRINNP